MGAGFIFVIELYILKVCVSCFINVAISILIILKKPAIIQRGASGVESKEEMLLNMGKIDRN